MFVDRLLNYRVSRRFLGVGAATIGAATATGMLSRGGNVHLDHYDNFSQEDIEALARFPLVKTVAHNSGSVPGDVLKARKSDFDFVEADVRETRGELYISHESVFGPLAYDSNTKALRVGGRRYSPDVLFGYYAMNNLRVYFDLKDDESTVVASLWSMIKKYGMEESSVFTGDKFKALKQLSFYAGRTEGFFYAARNEESKRGVLKLAEQGKLWGVAIDGDIAGTELVKDFSKNGIEVCIGNVVDPVEIVEFLDAGAKWINTDNLSLPIALHKSRNLQDSPTAKLP